MINKAYQLGYVWRSFGPWWLLARIRYAVRVRLGLLRRRLPPTAWSSHTLREALTDPCMAEPAAYLAYRRTSAPLFFFAPLDQQRFQESCARWDCAGITPLQLAGEIEQGSFRYFHRMPIRVGFPPPWLINPFTNQPAPADRHWSEIGDFGQGDIKGVWEVNRFGFVYTLVRAYWRGRDERYAELFWRLLEDWRLRNPPQRGPNWKCGQEISFRVMAWCFGLYGFLEAEATTAERVADLANMISVQGERIEANLDYALRQRNNHGISEGLGLWTIGSLFPELRSAARWQALGREVLETEARKLIYADGSFAQHSVNYHRLMLHDYLWALRLADVQGQPFSAELHSHVGKACAFLFQIQDDVTGHMPNYGHNDGALILPLNNCDYRDFRPVIQATHFLCTSKRCYESGLWDEDLLWLFGPQALDAPVEPGERGDLRADAGGYYTIRALNGFAFVRCATFADRPAHADMLHVDLWWRGHNVALDAGTYSYNAPPPWTNELSRTRYHNTVTVDDLDQMERVGRFIWAPWLHSRVHAFQRSTNGHLSYWEGEHDGYKRLRPPHSHRRAIVRIGDDSWLILDRLSGQKDHTYGLHWLLADLPYGWEPDNGRLTLDTGDADYFVQVGSLPARSDQTLVRGDVSSARGWQAPFYHDRVPALSLTANVYGETCLFWTIFGPEASSVAVDGSSLVVSTEAWQTRVSWRTMNETSKPLINSVSISGRLEDEL